MNNKVRFGFKNVHIAFVDTTGETQPTWKTPVKINGAVSLSTKPEGDTSEFYADDTVYFISSSNNGYSGDLGIALLPDEIKAEMLGWETDNNGALIEVADGRPKKFALMGEVTGDVKNRRFVFYDVQADRPDGKMKTKEKGINPEEESIPVKITPIEVDEKNVVKGSMELNETNATSYNSFFKEVYKPVFGTPTV